MVQKCKLIVPAEQNQILFRTPVGSRPVGAGEIVRLTDEFDDGISVADFKTVRFYARCRPNGTIPVTFTFLVLDRKEEELIFKLDGVTLLPLGPTFTQSYDVPGPAIVIIATGGEGTGHTGVDCGIMGFGPLRRPPYPVGDCTCK